MVQLYALSSHFVCRNCTGSAVLKLEMHVHSDPLTTLYSVSFLALSGSQVEDRLGPPLCALRPQSREPPEEDSRDRERQRARRHSRQSPTVSGSGSDCSGGLRRDEAANQSGMKRYLNPRSSKGCRRERTLTPEGVAIASLFPPCPSRRLLVYLSPSRSPAAITQH